MRSFLFVTLSLLPFLALAQSPAIIGTWEGADTAADSIYGTLKISKSTISWGENSPKENTTCHARYTILHETNGVKFKDQARRVYVTAANNAFKTYLLKIKDIKCAEPRSYLQLIGISYLRLTIQDKSPNALALVEYKVLTDPIGWMH